MLFHGHRVSVSQDEVVLEIGAGDGGTAASVHLMPLNCTSKNSHDGKSFLLDGNGPSRSRRLETAPGATRVLQGGPRGP